MSAHSHVLILKGCASRTCSTAVRPSLNRQSLWCYCRFEHTVPFLWRRYQNAYCSDAFSCLFLLPHLGEGIYTAEESWSKRAQVNSRGAEEASFVESQRRGMELILTTHMLARQEVSLCVLGDHILSVHVVAHHSVLNVSRVSICHLNHLMFKGVRSILQWDPHWFRNVVTCVPDDTKDYPSAYPYIYKQRLSLVLFTCDVITLEQFIVCKRFLKRKFDCHLFYWNASTVRSGFSVPKICHKPKYKIFFS